MSIVVYPDSKIYVVSPANAATGGPELLHQLVYHLRNDLKMNAVMYYIPENSANPIHPEYQNYQNPFTNDIEDNQKNILIVPEVFDCIQVLKNFSQIRKCVWWLSVDNFYYSTIFNRKRNYFFTRAINKIWKILFDHQPIDITEKISKNINNHSHKIPQEILNVEYHLVQSYYALNHLLFHNINKNERIYYLSDYLNEQFLNITTDIAYKEDTVVYNPKKGWRFTSEIIEQAKDIKFIPLINMTREQVIENLQKAKVYIDFGNHPGKDRIPREAAILGCCVITGKKGSAAFNEDVSIPEEYKFEDKNKNIPRIISKIEDCFDNFDERSIDFNYYRGIIKQEPRKFNEDLKKIFIKS